MKQWNISIRFVKCHLLSCDEIYLCFKALKFNYEKRPNTERQKCNTVSNHCLRTFMGDTSKFDECVKMLLDLLEEYPGHEFILLTLGIIHHKNGSVEGALKFYNELLERPDSDVEGVMQSKVSIMITIY